MSRRSRNYRAHRRPKAAPRPPREDGPYAWLPALRRRGVDPAVLKELIERHRAAPGAPAAPPGPLPDEH